MTDSPSLSAIPPHRPTNSPERHAQIYEWQQVRAKRAGGRLTLSVLLFIARSSGRGAKPSDPNYSPNVSTLAKKTGSDEKTMRRTIARLVQIGLVQRKQAKGVKRDLYRLATSEAEAAQWEVAASEQPARTVRTPGLNPRQSKPTTLDNGSPRPWTIQAHDPGQSEPMTLDNGSPRPKTIERLQVTENAAAYNEKEGEKSLAIRQEKQTRETDNYYQTGFTKICEPSKSPTQTVGSGDSFSAQETERTAGQPLGKDETPFHFHGTFTGMEKRDTLATYRIDKSRPHIIKALKDADGIPRGELGEAIHWKAQNCPGDETSMTGGLAWYRLGHSFRKPWEEWKKIHAKEILEQETAEREEREREEREEREAYESDMYDTKPENILAKQIPNLARLERELERAEAKRDKELITRLERVWQVDFQRLDSRGYANKSLAATVSRFQKSNEDKDNARKDAEHAATVAKIKVEMDSARGTIQQARQAIAAA